MIDGNDLEAQGNTVERDAGYVPGTLVHLGTINDLHSHEPDGPGNEHPVRGPS